MAKAPKPKIGRPTDYHANLDAVAYNHMKGGGTMETLAALLSKNSATVHRWRDKHPSFSDAIRRGRFECDTDLVESAMLKRACGYEIEEDKLLVVEGTVERHKVTKHIPPSEKAAIFWVKNRRPEDWRDKQEVEHTGDLTLSQIVAEAKKSGEGPQGDC